MEIAITTMSSKGQVVIPSGMREDIREGDKFIVMRNKKQIILEKTSALDEKLKEDLEFARRTEEAYRQIEKGKFTSMSAKEFLKKLEEWTKN
ncbi:AbrB/MazE/SpoVT family DNA-binding domain-containing protein [Candidatus Woesearchaeota archaeon]|nr:AbrB/MazE/SpoVT family DNA-binding domain-containing protein [Candidatus Woesearchaeota archaeon]